MWDDLYLLLQKNLKLCLKKWQDCGTYSTIDNICNLSIKFIFYKVTLLNFSAWCCDIARIFSNQSLYLFKFNFLDCILGSLSSIRRFFLLDLCLSKTINHYLLRRDLLFSFLRKDQIYDLFLNPFLGIIFFIKNLVIYFNLLRYLFWTWTFCKSQIKANCWLSK